MDRALPLSRARYRRDAGAKARTLARLAARGFDVPGGIVLLPRHLRTADSVASALSGLLPADDAWAVRSSAAVEDGAARSWAGQFHTVLDVPSERVPTAALEVAGSAAPAVYDGGDGAPPAVAVIVQRMVHPRMAGVVFSRNPVTGIRETVIEAVRGTADGLVSGREQPERWVRRGGAWNEQPDHPDLPEDIATRVADGAERIERELGVAVDAEWAWDGTLWWLQARPVTTGMHADVYSSRMAQDMLPGIILPLVWSVNGPVTSRAFHAFLEDVLGPLGVAPEDLSTLIHHRFYFNIGAFSRLFSEFGLPEDSLERLAGMEAGRMPPMRPTPTALRRLPRLVRAGVRYSRLSEHLEARLPELWRRSRAFAAATEPSQLSAADLLERMDRVDPQVGEVAFHHIATIMLMQMYGAWARSVMQREGRLSPGEPLDLALDSPSDHDVGAALRRLAAVAAAAPPTVRALVRASDLAGLQALGEDGGFGDALDHFLAGFGHFSDSTVNFTSVTWAEQPEHVLAMVVAALDSPPPNRGQRMRPEDLGPAGRRAWTRAAAYARHRDETTSLYAYTYGQYRPLVLALGERLSDLGALAEREDVFHLTRAEVRRVVTGALTPDEARTIVASRRAEIAESAEWDLPEVVVGDAVPLTPAERRASLRGVPVSRGRYTGRVVACRGIADLGRIREGDVVVVPFSDASWTPLFLRAGAIVAESGGMLSHSAILARELGVPAVTAVRGALRLADGELVSVDGFTGIVARVEETIGMEETCAP
jgi:pyruvate,water dikinase